MPAMPDITVVRNDVRHRFEAWIDDTMVGAADFLRYADLIIFTHTDVDPRVGVRGIGTELARRAADNLRSEGTHRVVPLCPFLRAWFAKNPEQADLLYRR